MHRQCTDCATCKLLMLSQPREAEVHTAPPATTSMRSFSAAQRTCALRHQACAPDRIRPYACRSTGVVAAPAFLRRAREYEGSRSSRKGGGPLHQDSCQLARGQCDRKRVFHVFGWLADKAVFNDRNHQTLASG